MFGYEFYIDPSRCIGCQSCLQACEECETHRGHSMINFDFIDAREHRQVPTFASTATNRLARRSVPRTRSREPRMALSIPRLSRDASPATMRARMPVRNSQNEGTRAANDEVRHVLRPDFSGKRPMCATVCPSQAWHMCRANEIAKLGAKSQPTFSTSAAEDDDQGVHDGAFRSRAIELDVVDYMWEGNREMAPARE